MRDPDRIPRMLAKLKVLWYSYPDLRLGQLVYSINRYATNGDAECFHTEDDEMEKVIDKLLKEGW